MSVADLAGSRFCRVTQKSSTLAQWMSADRSCHQLLPPNCATRAYQTSVYLDGGRPIAGRPKTRRFDDAPIITGFLQQQTSPDCYGDGWIMLNQKRRGVDLVHEDEWNSIRFFSFYGECNPCAPVSPRARLPSDFARTYGGSDHVTGQASFEAETQNQGLYREGAGCRRFEFFAGGWCIRSDDAHC